MTEPAQALGARPLIAIPARFSASASAIRYAAEVVARKLAEAVFAAGGEPVGVHPAAPGGAVEEAEVGERLAYADGVLLPGGGDLSPELYGGAHHPSLYDLNPEQDAFDLAVARWALATGRPLLAVCRGLQVVNVARGGTIVQDMPSHHRHLLSELDLAEDTVVRQVLGRDRVTISCYHHQALDRLGTGLVATAHAEDGVIEAVELTENGPETGWFLGVQWHPEDTAAADPAQQAVFDALVAAARRHAATTPLS